MDLERFEDIVWRARPEASPSSVARAVEALRPTYLAGGNAPRSQLDAKLLFYGVADAGKLGVVLAELAAAGALPARETWEILDLGAGPGPTSLALAEWLRARGLRPRIRLTAVDTDEAALALGDHVHALYASALSDAPPIERRRRRLDLARAPLPAGPFDLVLCANLLCELGGAASERLLRGAARILAPDGSVCVIEPALRETARALHAVRDALVADGTYGIFAPCLRAGPCPMLAAARDWCHEDRPIELPERTRLVARLAGLRRHSLKFSYLTLRRDGRTLGAAFPGARFRVVSELLVSKGRDEVFLCGEAGRLRVLRNRRDRSDANRAFDTLDRGRLVALDGAPARLEEGTRVIAWDPLARA